MMGNGRIPRFDHPVALRLGSPSIRSVGPRALRYAARCTAVVLLPTPPLKLATVAIIGRVPASSRSRVFAYPAVRVPAYLYRRKRTQTPSVDGDRKNIIAAA